MVVVVFLLVHHVIAELPKQTDYVTKRFDSCPSSGYFFKREETFVDPKCYLCFCQESGEATCWPRKNQRCDVDSYQHIGERNDTRIRRSPNPIAAGLSDIFFKNAARDLFDKQIPQQCIPFQSSYSEGCPPVDWCIGCTVCDCDAQGHWDCHVLSFCDKDGPGQPPSDLKFPKKHRTRRRSYVPNSPIKKNSIKKPTRKPQPKKPKPTKPSKQKPQARSKNLRQAKSQVAKKKPAPIRKTAHFEKRPHPTRIPKKAPPPKKQPQKKNQPKKYNTKKQTKPGKRQWSNDKRKRTTITSSARPKRKLDATWSPALATQQILNDEDFQKTLKRQLSQSIMNEFKVALHGAVINDKGSKGKHKKKEKRSIVKKFITKNEPDSNETINGLDAKDTWLENSDINVGLIKDSNMVKVYQRYKRNAAGNKHELTNNSNSAGNLSIYEHKVEVTQSEPSIMEKENYFKYAIENNTQKLLVIREDHYKRQQSNMSTTTENTISDDDLKLTVLQLIDKSKKITNNEDQRIIETTTEKSIAKNETVGTILLTTLVTVFIDGDNKNKSITERLASIVENITEANDLKFQNWSNIKAIKEKQVWNNNITKMVPEIIVKEGKKVLHTSDVGKKVSKISKKYNVQRLVKIPPKPSSAKNKTDTSFVKKFINKFIDTTSKKGSNKANNVVKYLQRYFRKLFERPKNKKKSNGTRKKISEFEKHLQTICETFGPCHLDPEQQLKLQSKVELLNTETYKMLRCIKIIHGLLKLVDIAGNDKDLKNNSVKTNNIYFKDDIKKLQAILTNTYLDKINIDRVANTQLDQIDYIKKNAFTFMISAGKFAGILNDMITIIQTPAVITKNTLQRTSRFAEKEKDVQFDKLKKVLVRFNMVQNAFIQKIYKIIESKSEIIEDKKVPKQEKLQEEQNTLNNTTKEKETVNSSEYINIYTKNIIDNLRKLKNIAQKLESRSIRKKRDLRDEDAMEYLLVLMEYMMKQKRHLDSAPVNDGIDLLIEAIKHAPDIKPIRKKVLQNLPTTSTPRISTTKYIELITIKDDSSLDLNTMSKEGEDNITARMSDIGIIEQSVDDADNEIERENFIRKAFLDTTTDMDFYKKDDLDRTTALVESSKELSIVLLKENVENDEATKNIEKIDSSHERGDNGGKFEEGEEYNAILGLSTTEVYSENAVEADFRKEIKGSTTEFNINDIKMRHFNIDEVNNGMNVDKQIDWDEASYEDARDERNKTDVRRNKGEILKTSTTENTRYEDFSKEVRKEKKKWYHQDDVIYKKEMNLLNSLDYAVGRSKESKEEEQNSKEEADDKLSAEAAGY